MNGLMDIFILLTFKYFKYSYPSFNVYDPERKKKKTLKQETIRGLGSFQYVLFS